LQGWSALILAGGAGRRFGGGKLMADLAGAPVIRRVAERAAGIALWSLVFG
jgi:molybdenum cofactor cytidylyltransferase